MLEKIISGGQTGADQGALEAAEALGLSTGGWMPKGFLTERGPRPELAARFNLLEHSSTRYPERTQSNILGSDGTLLFGHVTSPGRALTHNYVRRYTKPLFIVTWDRTCGVKFNSTSDLTLSSWLDIKNIRVLNVAGNRESQNPGIQSAIKYFLITSLELALKKQKV